MTFKGNEEEEMNQGGADSSALRTARGFACLGYEPILLIRQ